MALRIISALTVFLVGIAATLVPSVAAEVSDVPTLAPTAAYTETSTPLPTSTPTATPTPTTIPTATPTPTATLDEVTRITASNVMDDVVPWGIVVEYMRSDDDPETALVLAVMAAESGGDPNVVSYAGACGVMQVIWKPWYAVSQSAICESSWTNIGLGMHILDAAIENAQVQGYGLEYGLAYYNCTEQNVHDDMCGPIGGLNYADKVLNFWLPLVEKRIDKCKRIYGEDFWTNSDGFDRFGCNW